MNRDHNHTAEAVHAETPFPGSNGLQTLIDLMPAIVWCAQSDGSTEFINQRFYEYTGLSPGEASGWGWQTILHPDDLAPVMDR